MSDAPISTGKDLSERALGAVLLAPAALLLLVIVVYPIATLFWSSLHTIDNANPAAGEHWAGLANYARAFDDDRFWHSLGQTFLYIVVTVPGALIVGLGLALLANQPFKVKWPVRLGLLLPWALPLVFAGLIFRWFFEYQTGIVNDVVVRLGFDPLQWLSSPTLATVAV
jgi:multiple sugar transport system permease protein